ncbi:hypothetical protein [Constantimarinum furrinae]|uniref:hypothetical protein n=1 Tax=Constantimarinum furrinae TaxID=2562285 RepID=UPI00164C2130|nr:hypothetical protein [Constantimarinum furrinae]
MRASFKYFLFCLLFCSFQSCLDLRNCAEKVEGKYYCENISGAENYLKLNADGTFSHSFKSNNIELVDSGTWQISAKSNCIIEFSNWKTFNLDGTEFIELGNGLLWISGNKLDIGPDGSSPRSFIKLNN